MNVQKLTKLGACHEAVEWARTQPDWETLWNNCERGDWMLWLLGKLAGGPRSKSRKLLVLAACDCAELALKYVPLGEDRPKEAIETARKWARGEATIAQVRKTADAVAAATAYAVNAAKAAYAVNAAKAAYAVNAATAAYAAYWAAYAAYWVTAKATAKKETLKKCADIVRKHYPNPPF
jgi:hypothetical protein